MAGAPLKWMVGTAVVATGVTVAVRILWPDSGPASGGA